MRRLILTFLLALSLQSYASETYYDWLTAPASLGSDGGTNYYTMISGEVSSGWTDTNSPVAIYYMQDTNAATAIVDSSGNGYDGMPSPSVGSGPTYTNLGARTDGNGDEIARELDGINDYIAVGNIEAMNFERTDPFSVTAQIKTTSATEQGIVSKGTGTGPKGWYFSVESSGLIGIRIAVEAGPNDIFVRGSTDVADGNWHSVCVTVDGSSTGAGIEMYVDGIQETKDIVRSTLTTSITNSHNVLVGARRLYPPVYFKGTLDRVAIYPTELASNIVYDISSNTTHPTNSVETRLTP